MSTQLETNLQNILTQKETYLIPTNIRAGVTVLGVQGNLEPDKPDQSKTVTPTTSQQVVQADTGYELAQVTVNAVTSAIDSNITAANIKNGVTILGVTGTLPSDISYGTTLPVNPNINDKFVKVNAGWTELDGIYNYTNLVNLTDINAACNTGEYIPGTMLKYTSLAPSSTVNVLITNEYSGPITIQSCVISGTYHPVSFPLTINSGSRVEIGDVGTYSAGPITSISFTTPTGEWKKIEFNNGISGTDYDTAVDTTEDILGTSDGE